MAETRKPENVGEVIFKSFGQGLQALSGILETDRQNKLQDLQLQMNMQVQQARLENLSVSTAKNQEALNLMHETPQETGQRKAAEALAETQDLLEGAYALRTGQPTHAPFATAFGGLQQVAETQGLDFTVPTPTGDIEFGEPKAGRFPTENELILSLFGERGLREELDPFAPTVAETKVGREQRETALENVVLERFRAINPGALEGKLRTEKGKLITDEITLQGLAESDDFVTKTPIEGTGFDLPFIGQAFGEETRQVDPELQQAISDLRTFREGGQIRSDDQVAATPTKAPTPRQDAIGWLSQATEDWARANQVEKDGATQKVIDFQVANGRLPNSPEELLSWLQ